MLLLPSEMILFPKVLLLLIRVEKEDDLILCLLNQEEELPNLNGKMFDVLNQKREIRKRPNFYINDTLKLPLGKAKKDRKEDSPRAKENGLGIVESGLSLEIVES